MTQLSIKSAVRFQIKQLKNIRDNLATIFQCHSQEQRNAIVATRFGKLLSDSLVALYKFICNLPKEDSRLVAIAQKRFEQHQAKVRERLKYVEEKYNKLKNLYRELNDSKGGIKTRWVKMTFGQQERQQTLKSLQAQRAVQVKQAEAKELLIAGDASQINQENKNTKIQAVEKVPTQTSQKEIKKLQVFEKREEEVFCFKKKPGHTVLTTQANPLEAQLQAQNLTLPAQNQENYR